MIGAAPASCSILATRSRRPLLITFAPCPLLVIFCPLPVRLRLVYLIPASVVILLPAVTRVLIDVAIVSGIHITAGGFTYCAVPPLRAGSGHFSSLRISGACHRSIGRRVVAHGGTLVSSRDVGAAPLSVRTGSLSGLSIGAGVRIIRLSCASAPIRRRN